MPRYRRSTEFSRASHPFRAWSAASGRFFAVHGHSHPLHPRAWHRQWRTPPAYLGAHPRHTLPSSASLGARWGIQYQNQAPQVTMLACTARGPRPVRLTRRSSRPASACGFWPSFHSGPKPAHRRGRLTSNVRQFVRRVDSQREARHVAASKPRFDRPTRGYGRSSTR